MPPIEILGLVIVRDLSLGLVRVRTQRLNRAFLAAGFFGEANPPAVVLEQMAEADPFVLRHQWHEVGFDLVGVGVARKSQPLGEAHNVGIDADRLLAEGVTEDNVGGFSSDTGKGQEIVQLSRHLALKAADEFRAAILDPPALDTIEVNPADIRAELLQRCGGVVFGTPILGKECGRNLIDEIVSRLRSQDESGQELERSGKVKVKFGVWVSAVEPVDDFFNSGFASQGATLFWLGSDHIVFGAEYDTSK